jgi:hypothetical protein
MISHKPPLVERIAKVVVMSTLILSTVAVFLLLVLWFIGKVQLGCTVIACN